MKNKRRNTEMRKKMKDNSLGEGKTKGLSVLQTLTNNIVWQSGVCLYFVGYANIQNGHMTGS